MTRRWHERLADKVLELGWSKAELARRSGVGYDAVNKMLRGEVENPRGDAMERLASAVGVSKLWLLFGADGEHTITSRAATTRRIPFVELSKVGVMGAVGAIDPGTSAVTAPADTPDTTISTRVEDWSMAPEFRPGDLLLIDTAAQEAPGRYVLALLKPSAEAVIRRYRVTRRESGGREMADLAPANTDFPTIPVDESVRIVGVVTHHIRALT